MQVRRIGYRVRGFHAVADRALCWSTISADAEQRFRILCFWEKHGLTATREAFGVSRRTLYVWRQRLRAGGGKPAACAPLSTRPHRLRQRRWPAALVAELRRLRTEHPNLGKEKLHPFLAAVCERQGLRCPSVRTIGRLIADAPDKMRYAPRRVSRFPQGRVQRRPRARKARGYRPEGPGDCVALDTIERRKDGLARYLITCVDLASRFSFALAFRTRTHAALTLRCAQIVFPTPPRRVLSDKGGEVAKHFHDATVAQGIVNWHSAPCTPKMTAHCERFNRTIQDEFVDYHEALLFDDVDAFNERLFGWLHGYNTKRPHHGIALRTPLDILADRFGNQCRMYWPNASTCAASPVAAKLHRHLDGDLELDIDPVNPVPKGLVLDTGDSYLDALVGARCTWPLSERWSVTSRADVSFGDTEGSWNASVMALYRTKKGVWAFGYRHLSIKIKSGDARTDLTMAGPSFGCAFIF